MKKIIIFIMFIVVSVWLTGCKEDGPQANSSKKPTPTVRAVQASKGTTSNKLDLTGSVIATCTAKIGSPAEGPVMNCEIREGDSVQKGQVLLKIGRRQAADALVETAKESLSREKEDLRRIEQLVEGGAIPAEELDMARLRVSRANAELSKAMESAGDYEIEAPWDGLVSKVYVTDGYFVAPRETLVEIYNPDSLVISAAVPERYAAQIQTGTKVEVKLDAWPGDTFIGHIERIYPYLDQRLRTRTVEIALEKSVDLAPGMFARLNVLLGTVNDAVIIPSEAIVSTPHGDVVFIVENGKAIRCLVKTGIEDGGQIQIVSGINAGDKVITAGNDKLKDGAAVKVVGQNTPDQNEQPKSGTGGDKQ